MENRTVLLDKFQSEFGYRFKNILLLEEAFTHSSYAKENGFDRYNERLEFLGDAMLELAASEMLYGKFYDYDEGKLTRMRSQLVRGTALTAWAKKMGLDRLVKTGKSLKGKVTDAMLENAVEAVFGALLVDSDYDTAKVVAVKLLSDSLQDGLAEKLDPKTALQELTQAGGSGKVPYYSTIFRPAPGSEELFEAAVLIDNKIIAKGKGKSIKEAEFEAAQYALNKLVK